MNQQTNKRALHEISWRCVDALETNIVFIEHSRMSITRLIHILSFMITTHFFIHALTKKKATQFEKYYS